MNSDSPFETRMKTIAVLDSLLAMIDEEYHPHHGDLGHKILAGWTEELMTRADGMVELFGALCALDHISHSLPTLREFLLIRTQALMESGETSAELARMVALLGSWKQIDSSVNKPSQN